MRVVLVVRHKRGVISLLTVRLKLRKPRKRPTKVKRTR